MTDLFSNLADRIRAHFNDLSPQQRLAASFVLRRPEDVAIVSMRTLAAQAGVQPVTFVRLARTLGFQSWEEFKEPFVLRMRGAPDLYSARAARLVEGDAAHSLADSVHAAHVANLQQSHALNDPGAINEAVTILENARTVFIAGFRSCFGPAYAFSYVYRLCRPDVVLLSGMGGGLESELRAVGPEDVVCIIGFKPYSREAVIVAEHAVRRGATVISVADSPIAPFAREARVRLAFSTEGVSFFPSLVAAWALTEQLLDAVVARGGDAIIEKLKSSEVQLQTLGVFVPN